MIIRYPALEGPKGLIVEEFTENVDVMPTLLDLAGLSTPTQCEGYSVRAFLEGEKSTKWRKTVHWEFDFRVFAERIGLPLNECRLIVHRDGRGKLVHFLGMPDIFFDLEADENEQHPLFEHSLMESFSSELNEWLPEISESPLVNLLATSEGMINLKNPE
jgi:arylsulfatase A-like enzyme